MLSFLCSSARAVINCCGCCTSPISHIDSDGHVLPSVAEESSMFVWSASDPALPALHDQRRSLQGGLDSDLKAGQSYQTN